MYINPRASQCLRLPVRAWRPVARGAVGPAGKGAALHGWCGYGRAGPVENHTSTGFIDTPCVSTKPPPEG